MYQIVESSEKALTAVDEEKHATMPFESLEVGKSFLVPVSELKEQTVRNAASKANKKLARKFKVIKHGEPHNVYEVARIA